MTSARHNRFGSVATHVRACPQIEGGSFIVGTPPFFVFSAGEGRDGDAVDTSGLGVQPLDPAEQPPEIAGGTDQIVLKPDFGEAAIAGLAQAVAADQFALRAFDAVAFVHILLESLGLHFAAAVLQQRVEFTDHNGAMVLTGADAWGL